MTYRFLAEPERGRTLFRESRWLQTRRNRTAGTHRFVSAKRFSQRFASSEHIIAPTHVIKNALSHRFASANRFSQRFMSSKCVLAPIRVIERNPFSQRSPIKLGGRGVTLTAETNKDSRVNLVGLGQGKLPSCELSSSTFYQVISNQRAFLPLNPI